jgi:hypothetical protein
VSKGDVGSWILVDIKAVPGISTFRVTVAGRYGGGMADE